MTKEFVCKHESCEIPPGRSGFCKKHCKRNWESLNRKKKCHIENCGRRVRRRNMCYKHIKEMKVNQLNKEDQEEKYIEEKKYCFQKECPSFVYIKKYGLCHKHYRKFIKQKEVIKKQIFLIFYRRKGYFT